MAEPGPLTTPGPARAPAPSDAAPGPGRDGPPPRARPRRPTLALVTDNIHLGVGATLWAGAVAAAERGDANLVALPGGALRPGSPRNALYDLIAPDRLDGVVCWTSTLNLPAVGEGARWLLRRLRPLPVVSLNQGLEGHEALLLDGDAGMREAVGHLVEDHGRRRPACVRGPLTNPVSFDRYRAYTHALARHRIPLDHALVTEAADFGGGAGARAIRVLLDIRRLRPGRDFDAVVACSDVLAADVLRCLTGRGIRVPEDVAVLGFNDSVEARLTDPPLTSVSLPFTELGSLAVETLLARLRGTPPPVRTAVPGALVIRRSCGCHSPLVVQGAVDAVDAAAADGPSDAGVLGDPFADCPRGAVELGAAFGADLAAPPGPEAPGAFLPLLEAVLARAVRDAEDARAWDAALLRARRLVLPRLADEARGCGERLLGQARLMVADKSRRLLEYARWADEQEARRLRELGTALTTATDTDALTGALAERLPAMGVQSCRLVLYEDGDGTGTVRPVPTREERAASANGAAAGSPPAARPHPGEPDTAAPRAGGPDAWTSSRAAGARAGARHPGEHGIAKARPGEPCGGDAPAGAPGTLVPSAGGGHLTEPHAGEFDTSAPRAAREPAGVRRAVQPPAPAEPRTAACDSGQPRPGERPEPGEGTGEPCAGDAYGDDVAAAAPGPAADALRYAPVPPPGEDRRFTLVAEPLHLGEERLGFALFDAGSREGAATRGALYRALGDQVSAALKGIRLLDEVQRARDAAERASKLKTRLLDNATDELRTPVEEILRRTGARVPAEADPAEVLRTVHADADRLLGIVDDLLDLSRSEIDALDLSRLLLDPRPLLAEAFAEVTEVTEVTEVLGAGPGRSRPRVRAARAARTAVPSPTGLRLPRRLPVICADPPRLRQILVALLTAAAGPRGGAAGVTLSAEVRPPVLRVRVEGTGLAVSREDAERLLEPFASAAPGTRLGPAVARRLAVLHGGSVSLCEAAGRSGFRLELPLPTPADAPCPVPGPADGPPRRTLYVASSAALDDRDHLEHLEHLEHRDRLDHPEHLGAPDAPDDPGDPRGHTNTTRTTRTAQTTHTARSSGSARGARGGELGQDVRPSQARPQTRLPAPGPPEADGIARRHGWRIHRPHPDEDLAALATAPPPAAVAWDATDGHPHAWASVRALHDHPACRRTPFLLYGPVSGRNLEQALDALRPAALEHPVVVAEADAAQRRRLRRLLAGALPGRAVRGAADGASAAALLAAGPPCLLVVARDLPDMSGFDVVDRMREAGGAGQPPVPVLVLGARGFARDDLRRAEPHPALTLLGRDVLTDSELTSLLATLSARRPEPGALRGHLPVRSAVAFIEQHYRQPLSRRQIARAAGVSEHHLGRLFHRRLGLTLWDYLIRVRVNHAKERLRSGDESVQAVARSVGFQDRAYFSRVFRKVTGMAPHVYRDAS